MQPRLPESRRRTSEPLTWITLSAGLAVMALGATLLAFTQFVLSARELFKVGLVSVLVGAMGVWLALRMRRLCASSRRLA